MVHTKHFLFKLSKDELAGIVLDYQRKFNSVSQSVKDHVSKVKSKLNVLESDLEVSKNITVNLTKNIKTLECKCYENKQYSRKECLGISNIHGSINDSASKDTFLTLFRKVNVPIDLSNLEDCHRLQSSNSITQKVIIKLLTRKEVYRVFRATSTFEKTDVTENGVSSYTAIFINQFLLSIPMVKISKTLVK